jgi:hypothetical protein
MTTMRHTALLKQLPKYYGENNMKLQKSGPLVILMGLLWARLPGLRSNQPKGTFNCEDVEDGNALKTYTSIGTGGISWLSEGEQTIQMQKATPASDGKWKLVEGTYMQSQVEVKRESLTTFIIKILENLDGDLRNTLLFEQGNYIIVTEISDIVVDGNGSGKWTILAR